MSLYQYGFVRNKESSSTSEININEESYGRKELNILLEHFAKEKESNNKFFDPLIKKNE
ncbi:523_t:CDS:2, partial [Entrophospora sp. SA101]